MAYFVKIGGIPSNVSGVGTRGFHIYRRGCDVFTVWGAVEVRPRRRFFWAYTTTYKRFRRASPEAAIRKRRALVKFRAEQRGYSRLPPGTRIRRHAGSASNTRRK